MKRYWNVEFAVLASLFIGMLVLLAMVLDVRADIASLRRDAAYNAASGRGWADLRDVPSTTDLDARLRCLERRAAGEMGPRC